MTVSAVDGLAFDVVLQGRGVGLVRLLESVLPDWGREAFVVLTHLGDSAVLLAVAALVYLAYDRRAGGFVLGALFCGFAVVIATKAWFALARPPAELQYVAASGLGFPSGHAVGATVGWGAVALVLERLGTRRGRAIAAGAVIAVVALSRVAIGVHYVVDVVAGVAVGLAVLGLAHRWFRDEPLGLFGLAGGVAALAVAASGAAVESVALLGGTAGAVGGWQAVEPGDRPFGQSGVVAAGGGGVLVVAGVWVLDPTAAVAFGGAALVTAAVLVSPLARERSFGT